jgi:hypothetical protein
VLPFLWMDVQFSFHSYWIVRIPTLLANCVSHLMICVLVISTCPGNSISCAQLKSTRCEKDSRKVLTEGSSSYLSTFFLVAVAVKEIDASKWLISTSTPRKTRSELESLNVECDHVMEMETKCPKITIIS